MIHVGIPKWKQKRYIHIVLDIKKIHIVLIKKII
jgi:hypothetical protein